MVEYGAEAIKWVARNHYDTTLVTHPISPADDERAVLRCLYEGKMALEKKNELSKKYSRIGKHSERDALWEIPSWLERDDPPFDAE